MLEFKVPLKRKEKTIIKKVALIQIRCLARVLRNQIEDTDVVVECIKEGIAYRDLKNATKKEIETFQQLIDNPYGFFNLAGERRSISLHILFNFFEDPKYEEARRSIFRKATILEPLKANIPISNN